MVNTALEAPAKEIGVAMVNLTATIDEEVIAALAGDPDACALHCGERFCGYVFYADGAWHEEVWRLHKWRALISAPTPRDLYEDVCDRFGRE